MTRSGAVVEASIVLVLLSFQVSIGAAAEPAPAPELRRAHLEVVYSASIFRTLSRNDAMAAIRVWVDTVGRQKGFQLDCKVSVAEDVPELKRRLLAGNTGIVILDPLEYLELEGLGLLEPAFIGVNKEGELPGQFLLIDVQGSGSGAVSGLRGKSLAVEAVSRADLGRKWLEILLREAGLGPADGFFSSMSSVPNPSAAVLPVFFGKLGAGVVDKLSFDVMKEMNPQLGSKLRVVAASPPLLQAILCVDKRHVEHRQQLMESLLELHRDVAGRQILLVFKSNRLIPTAPHALEPVRSLWVKYRRAAVKTTASDTASQARRENP